LKKWLLSPISPLRFLHWFLHGLDARTVTLKRLRRIIARNKARKAEHIEERDKTYV